MNSSLPITDDPTLFPYSLISCILLGMPYPDTLLTDTQRRDAWHAEPLQKTNSGSKNNIASFKQISVARKDSRMPTPTKDFLQGFLQSPSNRIKALAHYYFTKIGKLYLQDGLNFAVDFVGYEKKPESEQEHRHSVYCIVVDDGSFTWASIQKYVKIAHNLRKSLLVARVVANPADHEQYFKRDLWEKDPPSIDGLFQVKVAKFAHSALK